MYKPFQHKMTKYQIEVRRVSLEMMLENEYVCNVVIGREFQTDGPVTENAVLRTWWKLAELYTGLVAAHTHTHTHNRFTAGLEYVRVHPGQQVPER